MASAITSSSRSSDSQSSVSKSSASQSLSSIQNRTKDAALTSLFRWMAISEALGKSQRFKLAVITLLIGAALALLISFAPISLSFLTTTLSVNAFWAKFIFGSAILLTTLAFYVIANKVADNQVIARTKKLTPEQLRALSPEQLRALSPKQLRALSPKQLGALSPEQLRALSTKQLRALSPEQLRTFSLEQLRMLAIDLCQGCSDANVLALFYILKYSVPLNKDGKMDLGVDSINNHARNVLAQCKIPENFENYCCEDVGLYDTGFNRDNCSLYCREFLGNFFEWLKAQQVELNIVDRFFNLFNY